MDYQSPQPTGEKKRSWLYGCAIGCFVFAVVVILVVILIAWLIFRARPQVEEEQFYTPEVAAFARFQIDALDNEIGTELMKNLFEQTNPPPDAQFNPSQVWQGMDQFLYRRHYIYLYEKEDGRSDFLAVIDVKRMAFVITGLLNSLAETTPGTATSGTTPQVDFKKITPATDLKGKMYKVTGPEKTVYIASTSPAILISNSQSRLEDALKKLSEEGIGNLSPEASKLLPSKNETSFVNGFMIWNEEWVKKLHDNFVEKNPDLEAQIGLVYDVITEEKIEGMVFESELVTADVLGVNLEIHFADPQDASSRAEILRQNLTPTLDKNIVELDITTNQNILSLAFSVKNIQKRVNEGLDLSEFEFPVTPVATPTPTP